MAHPTLNHPLPSIQKNQTPNSLPELAHFLSSPTYTDQTHPDKFVRWGKIVLDKVLPLDFGVDSGQNQGQQQQQQQQDQGRGQDQPTAQTQGDPSPSHPNSIPGSSSNPDSNSTPNTNTNSNTSNRDHRCSDLELDILHREAQGVDGPMTHRWGLTLWILARYLQGPRTSQYHPTTLLDLLERICEAASPADLGTCDEALGIVVRHVRELGHVTRSPDRAFNIAQHAINVVAPRSPTSLSSVHPGFVEMCYITKRDQDAQQVLDMLIDDVTFYKIRPMDFIEFHLFGGLIKLRAKQWEQAREYFELAVTAPAETTSPLQLEAHLKLVLVNLIIEGKTFVYPSYISAAMTKVIRDQGKVYDKLATAFEERNAGIVWMAKEDDFAKEHNMELLREVQRAFIEWQILDLTKVYSKLFLVDLADQIYAKEGLGKISVGLVEELVRDLVSRGKLYATITADPLVAPQAFVTFVENPEEYRSKATVDELNALIRQSKATGAVAMQRDRKMGLDDEFLNKVIRREEPTSSLAGGMADAPSGIKMPTLKGVGSNWNDMGY